MSIETAHLSILWNRIEQEFIAVHMLGRLQGRFNDDRMDEICNALGLVPMDISCTAIESIFDALETKVREGKILP